MRSRPKIHICFYVQFGGELFACKFKLINDLYISCHRKYGIYNYYKIIKLCPPRQLPAFDLLLYANIIVCADSE